MLAWNLVKGVTPPETQTQNKHAYFHQLNLFRTSTWWGLGAWSAALNMSSVFSDQEEPCNKRVGICHLHESEM